MKRIPILLILVLMAAGTTAAATQTNLNPTSVPGEFMYNIDKFTEGLQIAAAEAPVIGSSTDVAQVRAQIAQERLAEANILAEGNQSDKRISNLMTNYRQNIQEAKQAANNSNRTQVMQKVSNMTQKHVEVLKGLKDKVPKQAQFGINTAIETSSDVMEKMQKGLEMTKKRGIPKTGKKPADVGMSSSPF